MINKMTTVMLLIIAVNISFSQNINLSLKDSHSSSGMHYRKADLPISLYILGIVAFISPMAVFEDKKVFFGLTKEVSLGIFPYGRASFEYSYIFRSYNTSHLRFSYNYDFFLESGDFIIFTTTLGAGYFTDTKNKGWFGQLAGGAILAMSEYITFYPNLKYRYTFINEKIKSDIHDVSLGVAFVFYL
jgi:hypothetical protein